MMTEKVKEVEQAGHVQMKALATHEAYGTPPKPPAPPHAPRQRALPMRRSAMTKTKTMMESTPRELGGDALPMTTTTTMMMMTSMQKNNYNSERKARVPPYDGCYSSRIPLSSSPLLVSLAAKRESNGGAPTSQEEEAWMWEGSRVRV